MAITDTLPRLQVWVMAHTVSGSSISSSRIPNHWLSAAQESS